MKISTILTTTTMIAGMSIAALPASADVVDKRQANQAYRIQDGVRTGTLTKYEASRLKQEQAKIAHLERRYEHDGKLTYSEKRHLNTLQNKASRHINSQKHDHQVAPRRWYKPWSWKQYGNKDHDRRPYFRRWW